MTGSGTGEASNRDDNADDDNGDADGAVGAVGVARRFVEAVSWGEHTVVWELLSGSGRATAIDVAVANGLDRVRASRLRDDVSDPIELDEFLRQLLGGIRRDLRSVEVDRLTVARPAHAIDERCTAVDLVSPSAIPGTDGWRAGRLVLSLDETGVWAVDRLEPVIAGP